MMIVPKHSKDTSSAPKLPKVGLGISSSHSKWQPYYGIHAWVPILDKTTFNSSFKTSQHFLDQTFIFNFQQLEPRMSTGCRTGLADTCSWLCQPCRHRAWAKNHMGKSLSPRRPIYLQNPSDTLLQCIPGVRSVFIVFYYILLYCMYTEEPSPTLDTKPTSTQLDINKSSRNHVISSPSNHYICAIEVLQLVIENLYLSRPQESDRMKIHGRTDKNWGKTNGKNRDKPAQTWILDDFRWFWCNLATQGWVVASLPPHIEGEHAWRFNRLFIQFSWVRNTQMLIEINWEYPKRVWKTSEPPKTLNINNKNMNSSTWKIQGTPP